MNFSQSDYSKLWSVVHFNEKTQHKNWVNGCCLKIP